MECNCPFGVDIPPWDVHGMTVINVTYVGEDACCPEYDCGCNETMMEEYCPSYIDALIDCNEEYKEVQYTGSLPGRV